MKNLSMAVVVRQGKVLIQQRYRHNKGMVFEFPGGSVDSGENGVQAAKRELWEETGLRCTHALGKHVAKNEFGGTIHYIVLEASENEEPIVVDPVRKQTFFWFIPSKIPRTDFFEADLNFIETHLGKYT